MRLDLAAKSYRSLADPLLYLFLQSVESSTADKENILGVDLNSLLIRVLSSALRRNI